MTVDIAKIRPGDKVTLVPLEVKEVTSVVHLWLSPTSSGYFSADQIAAHHPAPREIGVGDRVRLKDAFATGTVSDVDGSDVEIWLDMYGGPVICQARDLTLVEGDQTFSEEVAEIRAIIKAHQKEGDQ